MTDTVNIPVETVVAAARALSLAGRWPVAAGLLRASGSEDPRILLAAAEVAVEGDWFSGTADASAAIAKLPGDGWDARFLALRDVYRRNLRHPGEPAPADASAATATWLRQEAQALLDAAQDVTCRGWASMYLGLISDNILEDRAAAPGHYEAALAASGDDPLLRREALRHLGDHDHEAGDHDLALERWRDATATGAAAGNVPGTLSQQLLLAVLARDAGDEAGAVALAAEVARWSAAIGAVRTAAMARAFVDGTDPTKG
ncbi:hypothetical protein ACFFX1_27825 [Dactylosporangium sucinum]|uniref:Uncharacterized protein n=1 Tax=Dactylosporangium sucinum TaxID=1424081 RepID=A0A917X4I7_9ACTN|nr:hypothetical protein [Dactylosporangium sucinum]GGM71988.1 hypothetical protein GCM10007977_087210 [Dactylosporangium sucinum]